MSGSAGEAEESTRSDYFRCMRKSIRFDSFAGGQRTPGSDPIQFHMRRPSGFYIGEVRIR